MVASMACGDSMCLPMLTSMTHLWATIIAISFPVTSAPSPSLVCEGNYTCVLQVMATPLPRNGVQPSLPSLGQRWAPLPHQALPPSLEKLSSQCD
jgi:hypothetical protein